MKILVAPTAFSATECRNQRGQLDKSNVRGEESTTQQRKPYFIKLENKNIMRGDKQTFFFKKKEWLEESTPVVTRRGTGGLVSSRVTETCRHTRHLCEAPGHPRTERRSIRIFRDTPGLFVPHSVAGLTFSPGQSRRLFAGENSGFPTTGSLCRAAASAPGEVSS